MAGNVAQEVNKIPRKSWFFLTVYDKGLLFSIKLITILRDGFGHVYRYNERETQDKPVSLF